MSAAAELSSIEPPARQTMRLFLCGDVMIGRGIDQVLPHPCSPVLHESYVHSASDYVRLAEEANGPIPRPVAPSYIWGAALDELNRRQPDARIINLETAITRSEDFAPKGINYRVSPENADCLTAASHRLLRARQQPRPRLGPCGLARYFDDTGASADQVHRRWPRPRRGEYAHSFADYRQGPRAGLFIRRGDERHPAKLGRNARCTRCQPSP